jgi:hypothetical protein
MPIRKAMMIIVAGLTVALCAVAPAAARTPTHQGGATSALAGTAAPLSPNGCPSGDFCVYINGNGGNLCMATSGNSDYWGDGCANNEDSVFNNGTSCGGCQDVNIYWGYGATGAYTCLQKGHYLLYMTQNRFECCPGRAGYNEVMANNAVSHRWTYC